MNNYCLDSKRYSSSTTGESVLTPPLTPALSQPHPYDKRQSTDLGYPYRYSLDYNSSWMTQPTIPNVIQPPKQSIRKQPNKQNKHVCTYPDCDWSFKRYEHLKRHMLVHTGERPHVCSYPGCGKRFSRSDNFHAHARTHEKNAFKQKQEPEHYYGHYPLLQKQANFVYHEESKKPHACEHPHCDRRFRRLEHLKRHARIHTNEQPFQCNFSGCFKSFSRSDNLTQHKKTHERRESQLMPEHFPLVDFIREDNTKLPLFGWQHPGDNTP
ncbi:unnamed protein product [Rhizopus stolonifer]